MFFFAKAKEDSSESESLSGKPPPLRRHDTFGSAELFEAWAKDSFINQSTIDILVKTHQIDCLPAVLALKKDDYSQLNLPVGQRRLLESAVEKLRQEYELVQPPTPKAKINLEMPVYKSMLEIGELAEEEKTGQYEENQLSRRPQSTGHSTQRIYGKTRSYVESGTEKSDSGPEKKALLVSEQGKILSQTTPKSAQKTKDGKSSPRQSQEKTATSNYTEDSKDDDDMNSPCACQRWLFTTLLMPIFAVLSVIGFVLVVLLMPFRLCCPQGGVYTNVVTFIFEVFMMAPCLACKWARGKRTTQANSASKKPRYGGTDDLELGDK